MSVLTMGKIKKRSGDIVDFDSEKIRNAVGKAFLAVRDRVDEIVLGRIVDLVIADLAHAVGSGTPMVEDVQNVVEHILMKEGYFDVAKDYIIYRYEHTKQRERKIKAVLDKIVKQDLYVVKRCGERERFSLDKLKRSLAWVVRGYESVVDVHAIALQCEAGLYDTIPTKEISRALVLTVRSLIEQDPAYATVASRLLLRELYRDVFWPDGGVSWDAFDHAYRDGFIRGIKRGVEIGRLDVRLLNFDLEALARFLMPERDELLRYLGAQTLYDRYLLSDPDTHAILETPQAMWMRVAMGLAINETDKTAWVGKFYETLSTLRFVSSTPTLFHAGTKHPQLSSCYLNTVEDSLDHIFKVIGDNAQLSKWSGGIGTDWTNLRATGALIRGTGVESQGVIPFLKIANDTTVAINRSGRRRGAACVYLETWHMDIEHFLELRKNTGDERRRTHDMDTSNWIPDVFMKRVRDDAPWTLFSPDEVPDLHHIYGRKFEERYAYYEGLAAEGKIRLFKTMKARDLWKKMLSMLYETGHPWITFKDPSNIRSPQDHAGVVHNSNLCTEITLNTSSGETAVCNLGSVNLAKHITNGHLDLDLLGDTVTTAMRMLDNVVDVNFYPTPEARASNVRHRPVGLGIMGFQDALYLLDINFDSEACVEFADRSMEAVSYYAILASSELARERGTYESYRGSKWDRGIFPIDTLGLLEQERGEVIPVPRATRLDWNVVRESVRRSGIRNSNCLAVAPTATIANIAGCSATIEPTYKNIYVKSNVSGDFTVVNNYLVEELKKLGLWDFEMLAQTKFHDGSIRNITQIPERIRNKYKETFEIDPRWLIRAAAARGKWIDQSQSLNIYFAGSSGKELGEIYQYAWSLGLKTTYYLRTLAASQVEKSTVNTSTFGVTHQRKREEVATAAVQPELTKAAAPAPAVAPVAAAVATPLPSVPSAPLPAASTPVASSPDMVNVKLCRLDDPTCESCQ